MKDILGKTDIIIPFADGEPPERGSVVRRVGNGKDQQGCFTGSDDDGGMILVNVIDINEKSFVSPAGILNLKEGDVLYRYCDGFGGDNASAQAREIVREWPLFIKNPDIQDAMMNFVRTSYTPRLILYLRQKGMLDYLFVPLQQKFGIGRFVEKVNWDRVRKERFAEKLLGLKPGRHLTYLAMIPRTKSYSPLFYSVGTKPHQETEFCLKSEPFNFVPTHGGHIKELPGEKGARVFLVDAGSNYVGKGNKTSLATAKEVTDAMKELFRDCRFIPVEGRGAFGENQSY